MDIGIPICLTRSRKGVLGVAGVSDWYLQGA